MKKLMTKVLTLALVGCLVLGSVPVLADEIMETAVEQIVYDETMPETPQEVSEQEEISTINESADYEVHVVSEETSVEYSEEQPGEPEVSEPEGSEVTEPQGEEYEEIDPQEDDSFSDTVLEGNDFTELNIDSEEVIPEDSEVAEPEEEEYEEIDPQEDDSFRDPDSEEIDSNELNTDETNLQDSEFETEEDAVALLAGSNYLNQCDEYNAYSTLIISQRIKMFSLPTDLSHLYGSYLVGQIEPGVELRTDKIYRNPEGELWYHGTAESGPSGYFWLQDWDFLYFPSYGVSSTISDFTRGNATNQVLSLSYENPIRINKIIQTLYKIDSSGETIIDTITHGWVETSNEASVTLQASYLNSLTAGNYKIVFDIYVENYSAFYSLGEIEQEIDFEEEYFTVSDPSTQVSTLTISPTKTKYTINKGNACSIGGTITSNYNITNVIGKLDGTKYTEFAPNSKTVDIGDTSKLNSFRGASLSEGTHQIVITATDGVRTVSKTITIEVVDYKLTIRYSPNGGTLNSEKYGVNNGIIITQSNSAPYTVVLSYGEATDLKNDTSFGLTRAGYTFVGWSLSQDGSTPIFDQDISYKAEQYYPNLVNGSATVTMYAQWRKVLTIQYSPNGGTLNSTKYGVNNGIITTQADSAPYTIMLAYGEATDLKNDTSFGITLAGYTFVGWSLSPDGSTTIFDQDISYKAEQYYPSLVNGSATVTMYAQWKKVLTIRYSPNGGALNSDKYGVNNGIITTQADSAPYTIMLAYGEATDLKNDTSFGLTRAGYMFDGWSLSQDGSTTIFDQDIPYYAEQYYPGLVNGSATVTMYAQWKKKNVLTIQYSPNGGTLNSEKYGVNNGIIITKSNSAPYMIVLEYGESTDLKDDTSFGLTRAGYTFAGWSLSPDGSTTIFDQTIAYKAEQYYPDLINGNATVTMYAQWQKTVNILVNDINFPDQGFRSYINDTIDVNKDNILSNNEIAAVTTLDLSYSQYNTPITSLKGIEYFTSLETLDVSNHIELTSLDLTDTIALKNLRCVGCNLQSLNVTGCPALETLDCDDNQLTSLNLSANSALKSLQCKHNQLTSLDLTNNSLSYLDCSFNQLTSLSLSSFVPMRCYGNSISVIDLRRTYKYIQYLEPGSGIAGYDEGTPYYTTYFSLAPDDDRIYVYYDPSTNLIVNAASLCSVDVTYDGTASVELTFSDVYKNNKVNLYKENDTGGFDLIDTAVIKRSAPTNIWSTDYFYELTFEEIEITDPSKRLRIEYCNKDDEILQMQILGGYNDFRYYYDIDLSSLLHIHTPAQPVMENEIAATCTAEGSYDLVTYCSECNEEISRQTVVTEKLEHVPQVIPGVPATCTESGLTEGRKCSICGEILVTQKVTPALGHQYENGVCIRCGAFEHENGWAKDANGIWYYYTNGVASTGWKQISGTWYLFNNNGQMLTGWQKKGGTWYYFKSSGAMVTGWQTISSTRYYFKSSGAMVTGWQTISGTRYYFKSSGAMVTGWQKIDSKWYYFKKQGDDAGVMLTGWQKISKKWYYFGTDGVMCTGWKKISKKWYYFNSSGVMLTGTQTIDGKSYTFDSSGAWTGK